MKHFFIRAIWGITQVALVILSLSVFNSPLSAQNIDLQTERSSQLFRYDQNNSANLHQQSNKYDLTYSNREGVDQKNQLFYITPAILITGGTALHLMKGVRRDIQDLLKIEAAGKTQIDDYLQYAPLVALYALPAIGIERKNNFGNSAALTIKSFLLNGFITDRLKYWINEERPNGGVHSFPSGHTSKVFSFAHLVHREYGELSPWYSIGAYGCAVTVGFMRVAKSAHWMSDVLAGAGIGLLSTELIYRTHQYKWDNHHLKNFDIFPFRTKEERGVTLLYTF